MKQFLSLLCLLLCTLPSSSQEVEEIHVNDAISFVHALRSNRIVVIDCNIDFENELQNLAQYNPDEIQLYREWEDVDVKAIANLHNRPYLTDPQDGPQLNLHDIHNLTIRSANDNMYLLRIQPRYAYVLRFVNCSNIRLENLVMGHTEGGYCEGGVVAFENCQDVAINHCDLYGCGMEGINFLNSSKLRFNHSIIRDCTYQIMDLRSSSDIVFENSLFMRNKEFTQVIISGCNEVHFNDCLFHSNQGKFISAYKSEVKFTRCDISHDIYQLGDVENVIMEGCNVWNSYGVKDE